MTVYAILAIVVAVSGLVAWASRSGANSVKAKQAKAEAEASEERLEMNREATEAERLATGMTDEEARKEAMKWARKP